MKIILKPLGIVVVGAAILSLSVMALRGRTGQSAPVVGATAPAKSSAPVDSNAVIYDDALKNGWENFSWAKNDFQETKTVSSGSCIRVESRKFEAVYFHHAPMTMKPYDRITFRIHGGEKGGQQLRLAAQYEENKETKNAPEYLLPALTPKEWQVVTVPLRNLGVAGKSDVIGFWLQEGLGKTLTPYYVDEVRLLRPEEAGPTG